MNDDIVMAEVIDMSHALKITKHLSIDITSGERIVAYHVTLNPFIVDKLSFNQVFRVFFQFSGLKPSI